LSPRTVLRHLASLIPAVVAAWRFLASVAIRNPKSPVHCAPKYRIAQFERHFRRHASQDQGLRTGRRTRELNAVTSRGSRNGLRESASTTRVCSNRRKTHCRSCGLARVSSCTHQVAARPTGRSGQTPGRSRPPLRGGCNRRPANQASHPAPSGDRPGRRIAQGVKQQPRREGVVQAQRCSLSRSKSCRKSKTVWTHVKTRAKVYPVSRHPRLC
jgi:hypothetical protein